MKKEEKEQLQKEIDRLQDKLNSLDDDLKVEVEVGRWYKINNQKDYLLCYQGGRDAYGFVKGKWVGDRDFNSYHEGNSCLATGEEIVDALIREAERRGFKAGVKCSSVIYSTGGKMDYKGSIYWDYGVNAFMYLGMYILKDGKWAEIFKEETKEYTLSGGTKVTITKDKIDSNDGGVYTSRDLMNIQKELNYSPNLDSLPHKYEFLIKLGCETVSAKDIKEILKLQKECH